MNPNHLKWKWAGANLNRGYGHPKAEGYQATPPARSGSVRRETLARFNSSERELVRPEAVGVEIVVRDGNGVVGVERPGSERDAGIGSLLQRRPLRGRERPVVREDEDRVLGRRDIHDGVAVAVEFDDRAVGGVESRGEVPSDDGDAGGRLDGLAADGLVAAFEGGPDQRGGAALAGVEPAQVRPLEDDGVLLAEHEVRADVLADVMREKEGGRDTPTEDVEAAGAAGEVVEREVGGRRRVVADDDELARSHTRVWTGPDLPSAVRALIPLPIAVGRGYSARTVRKHVFRHAHYPSGRI